MFIIICLLFLESIVNFYLLIPNKKNMDSVLFNDNTKIEIIRQLNLLKNEEDFVNLLNYVQDVIKNNDVKNEEPISVHSIIALWGIKDSLYHEFFIKKKDGTLRKITAPQKNLKNIQTLLNIIFQIVFEKSVQKSAKGFLIGKSIVDNARPHLRKRFVLNLDLKNFFPTIHFGRIKAVLKLKPFNLKEGKESVGLMIANLCTYKGYLPQGAPSSPIISNIVTQNLDKKITRYCSIHKVKYTRYADDLTFSSNKKIFDEKYIDEIEKIIKEEGFVLNKKKTRLKTNMDRQEVTGIIVNEKLNVNRNYIRNVRAMLHNWEVKGVDYAIEKFKKHYSKKENKMPDFIKILEGYIAYIRVVRGKEDALYLDFKRKFNYLKNRIDYSFLIDERIIKRLSIDNEKMEKLIFNYPVLSYHQFVDFCVTAFLQIENLLYFYYWKKYPIMSDLLEFIYVSNKNLTEKWLINNKKKAGKIGDLNIYSLVNTYENEFYFSKKISYNKSVSKLRLIRNDNSHRNEVDNRIVKLKNDYCKIEEKKQKGIKLSKQDIVIEKKYIEFKDRTEFIENNNLNNVRQILKDVVKNIKEGLEIK